MSKQNAAKRITGRTMTQHAIYNYVKQRKDHTAYINVPRSWIGREIKIILVDDNDQPLAAHEDITKIVRALGNGAHVYVNNKLAGEHVKVIVAH